MSEAISTFVVDDEPLARRRLQRLLRADPGIRVVGTYGSAAEAASAARDLMPQLLVLDIRMPERDGFELVSALTRCGQNPYTIFVTAYSDRSLDAFAVGAVDYLLKPVDEERLARAISRAKRLIASSKQPDDAALTGDATRLLLVERGTVVVLSVREIEFFQTAGRHVKIYAGGRCYVSHRTIGQLELRLNSSSFVRIHRSTVINIQYLAEMRPTFHGDYEVVLKRGTRLTLSRRYRDRLSPFFLDHRS